MELTNTYIPKLGIMFKLYCPIFLCCSVLQCVAVCCSVLQCVAVCCLVKCALCTPVRAHQFVHSPCLPRPLSISSLSFSRTHTLLLAHTHTHSLSHTHMLSPFSLLLAFSFSCFLSRSHSVRISLSLSCCLFLYFICSIFLFLSLFRFALPHRTQRLINHYHFQRLSVCFALTGGHA